MTCHQCGSENISLLGKAHGIELYECDDCEMETYWDRNEEKKNDT